MDEVGNQTIGETIEHSFVLLGGSKDFLESLGFIPCFRSSHACFEDI